MCVCGGGACFRDQATKTVNTPNRGVYPFYGGGRRPQRAPSYFRFCKVRNALGSSVELYIIFDEGRIVAPITIPLGVIFFVFEYPTSEVENETYL